MMGRGGALTLVPSPHRPAFAIDQRVRFGGRDGTVVTYQTTPASSWSYGVVLDTGAWLPNLPEAALLEELQPQATQPQAKGTA